MQIIQYSKNCLRKKKYFINADEGLYLDLRVSKGSTGNLEKLQHKDREITLKINLKAALMKKMWQSVWRYS